MYDKFVKVFVLLLLSLMLVNVVSATDFNGLDSLISNNDVISLDDDVVLSDVEVNSSEFDDGILINKNVTIDGNGHFIDAKSNNRIFNVVNCSLTLKNITLKNGYYYGYGGAICAESSVINLEDVVFCNNVALIGGAIMTNNTDINMVNNVVFNNNSAYVGGAIAILSRNVLDTKYATFDNNRAYYAVNVFSKGDVVFHDSGIPLLGNGILYYSINFEEKDFNSNYEINYDKYFNDYSVNVFDTGCLLDSFKSLNSGSSNLDNAKNLYDAFGKTYYVNGYTQLSNVFKNMSNICKLIDEDPNYSVIFNNNIAKSNFLTANIVLLPTSDYFFTKTLNIGYSGKKDYDMNITIEGNGLIINCSLNEDYYLFSFIRGNLFLNNLTITGGGSKGLYMCGISTSMVNEFRTGLYISNCNFVNNVFTHTNGNLLSVSELYIGDNVNFINNAVNYGISSSILIINGSNINFINNSFKKTFLKSDYTFITADSINFINNRVINIKTDNGEFLDAHYLFIISNNFKYSNNNAKYGFVTSNSYIDGNNLSFINNNGTIFKKLSCDDRDYTNKKFNHFFYNESYYNSPNFYTLGKTLFISLLNKYNIGNITGSLIIKANSSFINNYGDRGSIFYIISGNNIYLSNLSFINNSAINGGVMYIQHFSSKYDININADSLYFYNNRAKNGGVIYLCSPTSTTYGDKYYGKTNIFVNQLTFVKNYAEYGGAIFSEYNKINLITKNTFLIGNRAEYGGALYLKNTNMNITNNKAYALNNVANVYGSVAYVFDSVLAFKGNSSFNNNIVFYNISNHVMNNGKGWDIPFFINKNSLVSTNNETSTYDQFVIASNDILEYCSKDINFRYCGRSYNVELNKIVLDQTLKQYGFNSVEEFNESNCNMTLFSESLLNNYNKLFDVNNYNSYLISQKYVLMDGSIIVHNTEFVNIHNVDEFISFTRSGDRYHYNVGNKLVLNFEKGVYVFPKKYLNDLSKFYPRVIYINGNGAEFRSESFGDTSMFGDCEIQDCQFMEIASCYHVYINDLTFTGFNVPFVNEGYLFLNNCIFNQNRVVWLVKQDYGVIHNKGFLKCANCSFVGNKAKYGCIYNAPGSYCGVINCSFKDTVSYHLGHYDIWNYNDGVAVNCTFANTDCSIYNEAGTPKWFKIFVTVVVTGTLAIATGYMAGGVGATIGGIITSNMIAAGFTSVAGMVVAGAAGGLLAGALVGAGAGFVAGSLEAVLMGGLYREPVDKIFLDYAVKGTIMGAISGGISGAIGGSIAAYNKVIENIQRIAAQELAEQAAREAGKRLPTDFKLDPEGTYFGGDNSILYTAKYFPGNDPKYVTYYIDSSKNLFDMHRGSRIVYMDLDVVTRFINRNPGGFIEMVSQNLFGKVFSGVGSFEFNSFLNVNQYLIKFDNGFVFRLFLGF